MLIPNIVKIRTICKDKATGSKGMVTHLTINMDKNVSYVFQPSGLNESGEPLDPKLVDACRLDTEEIEGIDVPVEILGSIVTDDASGFTGTAIELWMHPNGCFHVNIQPKGKTKTGNLIKSKDFDIRQCSGLKIPKMTEKAKEVSRQANPSPAPIPTRPFR